MVHDFTYDQSAYAIQNNDESSTQSWWQGQKSLGINMLFLTFLLWIETTIRLYLREFKSFTVSYNQYWWCFFSVILNPHLASKWLRNSSHSIREAVAAIWCFNVVIHFPGGPFTDVNTNCVHGCWKALTHSRHECGNTAKDRWETCSEFTCRKEIGAHSLCGLSARAYPVSGSMSLSK